MLAVDYHGFRSRAWERLFQIQGPIYVEATYEFYSEFEFKNTETNIREKSVSFVLGGQPSHLSLVDFALALGLYTLTETQHPQFDAHLNEAVRDYNITENE